MKVKAHNLNVSITGVSSSFRKSLKKLISFESLFFFPCCCFLFQIKILDHFSCLKCVAFFSETEIDLPSQNCFNTRLV